MKRTEDDKINVLLISEGTYPFYGGGISTWSHMLCDRVSNVHFNLYSINAGYIPKPIFELSPSVKEVIQVPLWAPDEPQDYVSYKRDYYKVVSKKEETTSEVVQERFIPIFEKFLQMVYEGSTDMKVLDVVFYELWLYFQDYDYKRTMQDQAVWEAFKYEATRKTEADGSYVASLFDITVGLRWLYRFLIPFSIPIKKMDLCHITLSGFPLIPALVLKYRYGTPLMITEHGVYVRERLLYINRSDYSYFIKDFLIRLTETITRLSYYKADKILSVNKFNITWELMYGASEDKIEITYNGVDHEKFAPRQKPEHLRGIPTVVAAARIFELKDVLTMIRSCDVVRKKIPNVRYLVYGDKNAVPEYTEQCENLIKQLKLENNFFLMGYHSEPHLIFSEGDISILTSISEGFPFTVIESMSCGVPVVATDVGGVAEAIDEGSGFVCKPRDPEAIGKRVIQLLEDEELRKTMSVHARKRVMENFTLDIFIESYERIYEEVYQKQQPKKQKIKKELSL
ncbi:GT4 family glycosyltransferase PelF [Roseivirga thermotolerans]|uniref:GT4 family glycosyltransferase PelF n=1 Tax=Roseivirga thermotolerans TaxID=1758176 RepID=UPI00273F07E4|nr:GT4 family glycosyltransferase PelF [Roseivirga thermotolerans]